MEEKNYSGIIPENQSGKPIDAVNSIQVNDPTEAKAFFETVKNRLLNVNDWEKIAGTGSASFQLVDSTGIEVNRPVQKGDFFKIDIPGPGPTAGDGYDWVIVEELEEVAKEDVESIGIRVRPTLSPLNNNQDVAHFYSPESTSSFTVTREGSTITAGIYDRNTKPNKTADSLTDKVRDIAVGSGAVTAFSRVQWQKLAEGLLKKEGK
jgi:hypothetical protein